MSPWLDRRAPLDRALAAALLALCAPVIAVLAVLKRLEDRGPAFVRLPRVGRHGRRFDMLKLRTMRVGGGAPITAGEDDRITPLGRRLRRLRLDELPQLVHVAKGEMALIGPRPEAPELVEGPEWATVLQARPGIAGPTQLVFEEIESRLPAVDTAAYYAEHVLPRKLRVDQWYVDNASPLVDLRVCVGLVQRFVLHRPPTAVTRVVGQ